MANISEINNLTNYPYQIMNITEKISNGQPEAFFTDVNNYLDQTPFRVFFVALTFIVYGLTVWFRPSVNKLKAFGFSSFVTAILVGVASFGNFVQIEDSIIYLVLAGLTFFIGDKFGN